MVETLPARKVRRVVRTPPRPRRTTPSKRPTVKRKTVQKSTPSIRFSLIPEAYAVGPALGTVIKGGVRVAATLKQLKGVRSMRPTHDKKIKSVTYKNVIEGPIMKQTGGGVPLYKRRTFAVKPSGKINTSMLDLTGINRTNISGATRANQAMMAGGLASAKHKVTKKSFVKVIPGGPIIEFPGGIRTRYRKRELRSVKTKGTLVQGQDPTSFSPTKSGLDKYIPSLGAAASVGATSPFWDQIGDFFNPFPEAYAMPAATPVMLKAGQFLVKSIKGSWAQFLKSSGVENTPANKAEFQQVKTQMYKNLKGKKLITTKGTTGGGKDEKMARKKVWGSYAGAAATVGVVGLVGTQADQINAMLQGPGSQYTQPAPPVTYFDPTKTGTTTTVELAESIGGGQNIAGVGAGAALSVPSDLITDVAVPGTATLEERTDMQEAALLNLGFDAKGQPIKSGGQAGPPPGGRYGLPGEKGLSDPYYTKVSYKRADGTDATQWMKLGMTGMTAAGMSTAMTRQATKTQVNTELLRVQGIIQKKAAAAQKGGKDSLEAAAREARIQYAKPKTKALLGPLPQQYKQALADRGL